MEEAKTSKEMNFRSQADRNKLSDEGKSLYDGYEKQMNRERAEEQENYSRFFEQRVKAAENEMLRKPEVSCNGGPAFTIDGRQPRPSSVWKREELSPHQEKQLRGSAEQQVKQDHEAEVKRITRTYEGAQQALLDRELGPKRYERDRSYRDL